MSAWHGLRERLRGARGLEWLLLLVAVCVAALALTRGGGDTAAQPTELEARLERVLSAVEGAGEVRAMVAEEGGTVAGVVIVAAGAEDVGVRLSLMQAARALLDVELDQIEVIQMRRDARARTVVFDGLYLCAARGGDGAALLQTARTAGGGAGVGRTR